MLSTSRLNFEINEFDFVGPDFGHKIKMCFISYSRVRRDFTRREYYTVFGLRARVVVRPRIPSGLGGPRAGSVHLLVCRTFPRYVRGYECYSCQLYILKPGAVVVRSFHRDKKPRSFPYRANQYLHCFPADTK